MQPIIVHVGDDLPAIDLQIRNGQTREPVSLAAGSTTIIARFRQKGTTTTLAQATGAKIFGGTLGHVRFSWPAGALTVDPGRYEIQVQVLFGSDEQTLNRYWWSTGLELDDARVIPVRVRARFTAVA